MEKCKNNSRIFLLGAGFSAEAGVPTCPELINHTFDVYKKRLPNRYEGLIYDLKIGWLDKSEEGYNLSEICTYFDYLNLINEGEQGLHYGISVGRSNDFRADLFKSCLIDAINDATPKTKDIPDMYLLFAKMLNANSDNVFTFNWDCILEASVRQVGKRFLYPSFKDNEKGKGVPIYKLYGSLNFQAGTFINNKRFWKRLYIGTTEEDDIFYSKREINPKRLIRKRSSCGVSFPYIILPGFGKSYDVQTLAPLWARLDSCFLSAVEIYVIGLSISEDDFFIRQMWMNCRRWIQKLNIKVVIINPDESIEKSYYVLDGLPNVRYVHEKLSIDIINAIKSGEL